jgi:hypothetical protein
MRKRRDIRLVDNQISAERYLAKPNLEGFTIVNPAITMVELTQTKIKWLKPSYLGFCILDLSKLHMYDFHYNKIRERYGNNAKLLFTDTDSLCYHITTKDVYSDMLRDSHLYDTSDYPKDNKLFSLQNCKRVGVFKDECNGVPIQEFVGLRAKLYSIAIKDSKSKATAKGVKRGYAVKNLKHEMYRDCLFEEKETSATFYTIQSVNHVISTRKVCKDSLSCYDDKRYLLKDTTDTLSYGHALIAENYST